MVFGFCFNLVFFGLTFCGALDTQQTQVAFQTNSSVPPISKSVQQQQQCQENTRLIKYVLQHVSTILQNNVVEQKHSLYLLDQLRNILESKSVHHKSPELSSIKEILKDLNNINPDKNLRMHGFGDKLSINPKGLFRKQTRCAEAMLKIIKMATDVYVKLMEGTIVCDVNAIETDINSPNIQVKGLKPIAYNPLPSINKIFGDMVTDPLMYPEEINIIAPVNGEIIVPRPKNEFPYKIRPYLIDDNGQVYYLQPNEDEDLPYKYMKKPAGLDYPYKSIEPENDSPNVIDFEIQPPITPAFVFKPENKYIFEDILPDELVNSKPFNPYTNDILHPFKKLPTNGIEVILNGKQNPINPYLKPKLKPLYPNYYKPKSIFTPIDILIENIQRPNSHETKEIPKDINKPRVINYNYLPKVFGKFIYNPDNIDESPYINYPDDEKHSRPKEIPIMDFVYEPKHFNPYSPNIYQPGKEDNVDYEYYNDDDETTKYIPKDLPSTTPAYIILPNGELIIEKLNKHPHNAKHLHNVNDFVINDVYIHNPNDVEITPDKLNDILEIVLKPTHKNPWIKRPSIPEIIKNINVTPNIINGIPNFSFIPPNEKGSCVYIYHNGKFVRLPKKYTPSNPMTPYYLDEIEKKLKESPNNGPFRGYSSPYNIVDGVKKTNSNNNRYSTLPSNNVNKLIPLNLPQLYTHVTPVYDDNLLVYDNTDLEHPNERSQLKTPSNPFLVNNHATYGNNYYNDIVLPTLYHGKNVTAKTRHYNLETTTDAYIDDDHYKDVSTENINVDKYVHVPINVKFHLKEHMFPEGAEYGSQINLMTNLNPYENLKLMQNYPYIDFGAKNPNQNQILENIQNLKLVEKDLNNDYDVKNPYQDEVMGKIQNLNLMQNNPNNYYDAKNPYPDEILGNIQNLMLMQNDAYNDYDVKNPYPDEILGNIQNLMLMQNDANNDYDVKNPYEDEILGKIENLSLLNNNPRNNNGNKKRYQDQTLGKQQQFNLATYKDFPSNQNPTLTTDQDYSEIQEYDYNIKFPTDYMDVNEIKNKNKDYIYYGPKTIHNFNGGPINNNDTSIDYLEKYYAEYNEDIPLYNDIIVNSPKYPKYKFPNKNAERYSPNEVISNEDSKQSVPNDIPRQENLKFSKNGNYYHRRPWQLKSLGYNFFPDTSKRPLIGQPGRDSSVLPKAFISKNHPRLIDSFRSKIPQFYTNEHFNQVKQVESNPYIEKELPENKISILTTPYYPENNIYMNNKYNKIREFNSQPDTKFYTYMKYLNSNRDNSPVANQASKMKSVYLNTRHTIQTTNNTIPDVIRPPGHFSFIDPHNLMSKITFTTKSSEGSEEITTISSIIQNDSTERSPYYYPDDQEISNIENEEMKLNHHLNDMISTTLEELRDLPIEDHFESDEKIQKIIKNIIKEKSKYITPEYDDPEILRSLNELTELVNKKNLTFEEYVQMLKMYQRFNNYMKQFDVDDKTIELNDLINEMNLNDLTANVSNVLEMTYLVKSPKPVIYYPYYYVKYRLPYTQLQYFLDKIKLEGNKITGERLKDEILKIASVAETSPNLKAINKHDLLKLTLSSGDLIQSRFIDDVDTGLSSLLVTANDLKSYITVEDIDKLSQGIKTEIEDLLDKKEKEKPLVTWIGTLDNKTGLQSNLLNLKVKEMQRNKIEDKSGDYDNYLTDLNDYHVGKDIYRKNTQGISVNTVGIHTKTTHSTFPFKQLIQATIDAENNLRNALEIPPELRGSKNKIKSVQVNKITGGSNNSIIGIKKSSSKKKHNKKHKKRKHKKHKHKNKNKKQRPVTDEDTGLVVVKDIEFDDSTYDPLQDEPSDPYNPTSPNNKPNAQYPSQGSYDKPNANGPEAETPNPDYPDNKTPNYDSQPPNYPDYTQNPDYPSYDSNKNPYADDYPGDNPVKPDNPYVDDYPGDSSVKPDNPYVDDYPGDSSVKPDNPYVDDYPGDNPVKPDNPFVDDYPETNVNTETPIINITAASFPDSATPAEKTLNLSDSKQNAAKFKPIRGYQFTNGK